MARRRKKRSLYEVISETWPKPGYGKRLEQWRKPRRALHPKKSDKDEPTTAELPESAAQWPRRPKIVQFNAGKIEISMSYQLAIALLLGVVLLVLVVFRLGQISYLSKQEPIDSAAKTAKSQQELSGQATADTMQTPVSAEKMPISAEKAEPVKLKGNNRIVIQTYQVRAHLEPVKQYFARFGIETEIKKIGDWYYLVTSEKYENPEKPGTNGYLTKQKIIKLGAKYKAPPGYETFGKKPFHDSYGKRFDD